jgi:hypothetical protein
MAPLIAEVWDKGYSLVDPVIPLALTLFALIACVRWRGLTVFFVPLGLIALWLFPAELRDPFVGPALRREAPVYSAILMAASWGAAIAPIVGVVVGTIWPIMRSNALPSIPRSRMVD